ncbi:MAG: aminoacyl-tRNA hydrolase [Dehalococcoidia bacterium]|nr:aminoacyl-tRNA hydrolase [Dehalococcoidia bacterium]
MKLIAGLGNPGRSYSKNRHNVGYQCLDSFARAHRIEFNRKQTRAHIALGEGAGEHLVLVKPQTFMNRVGESIGPLLRSHGLLPSDLIVIYDDMDLPLGRVRIRERGSAGGHKGVQSIMSHIGTQEFLRIRVGIDHPSAEDVVDYVLSDFTREEQKTIDEAREKVTDIILSILTDGPVAAMNRFNFQG